MQSYILLVEDDPHIAEATVMILENEHYRVKLVGDLKTATQAYDTEKPSLILLDYRLPDGKPDEFVEHVQSSGPVPIILMTAASQSEGLAEALKIKDLVKKPFDMEDLLTRVARSVKQSALTH
jgi:DNA-binding response OmpR family regulator